MLLFAVFKHTVAQISMRSQAQSTLYLPIWSFGQLVRRRISLSCQGRQYKHPLPGWCSSDAEMMTTMRGVFVAGDVHRGVTFFVVDAINEGHHAARSIDRFLRGEGWHFKNHIDLPIVGLSPEDTDLKFEQWLNLPGEPTNTYYFKHSHLNERIHSFCEVDLTMTEEEALLEAERCLACGACSECLECLAAVTAERSTMICRKIP